MKGKSKAVLPRSFGRMAAGGAQEDVIKGMPWLIDMPPDHAPRIGVIWGQSVQSPKSHIIGCSAFSE